MASFLLSAMLSSLTFASQDDSRPPMPSGAPPRPPPGPPQPKGPVQVRRDYNPKAAQQPGGGAGPTQYLISPITGEKIPANKMEEHMRYGEIRKGFALLQLMHTTRAGYIS